MLAHHEDSRSLAAPRIGQLLSIFCATLTLLAVSSARPYPAAAQTIVINNGLAPPNPVNVIDSSDPNLLTLVRNVDCPPPGGNAWDPCPSPGASTHVQIVDGASLTQGSCTVGGDIAFENAARDSSRITVTGGSVDCLNARENSRVFIDGGFLIHVNALDDSTFQISGGRVNGYLIASNNAAIRVTGGSTSSISGIYANSSVPVIVSGGDHYRFNVGALGSYVLEGSNFAIDGVPLDYGTHSLGGTLSGTWASGESFSSLSIFADSVTLAPPAAAVPALPILPALALAAALLSIGAVQIQRRRVENS